MTCNTIIMCKHACACGCDKTRAPTPLPTSDSDSEGEKTSYSTTALEPEAPKSFRIGVEAGYKIVFNDGDPLPKIVKERSRKRKTSKKSSNASKPKTTKKAKISN